MLYNITTQISNNTFINFIFNIAAILNRIIFLAIPNTTVHKILVYPTE